VLVVGSHVRCFFLGCLLCLPASARDAANDWRTGRTLPVDRNRFEIDSGKEKTIYYEVVFQ
jgi:hypothetical protein